MTLKSYDKFEENNMEYGRFSAEHTKFSNWDFHWILLYKVEVTFYDNKELTCQTKIDMRNLTSFDQSIWKYQKLAL